MEITDVKIFKAGQKAPVLAYANVVFGRKFIIRGITLLETEKGRFISMPSRRVRQGDRNFRDTCHPLNSEVRKEIQDAVFEAYDEFISNNE